MRVALALCGALVAAGAAPAASAPGDAVSGTRALQTVTELTGFGPRVAGTPGEARAGRMVADRLRDLGYRVGTQRVPLPRGGASRNIVAVTPGTARVVVAAHLDGVDAGLAANDNASGVAAMLEVAAALKLRRGVVIAALGAEERAETGSSIHLGAARLASGLRRGRDRIRAAIVLDMVGVGNRVAIRGLAASPTPVARDALNRARALRLRPYYLPDRGISDHRELTFAGLPAYWIQRRLDACWHSPCDTADRVSAPNLAGAARLATSSAAAALRADSEPDADDSLRKPSDAGARAGRDAGVHRPGRGHRVATVESEGGRGRWF